MKLKLIAAACLGLCAMGASAQDLYLDRTGWQWSTSSDCAPEEDIQGIDAIADGNDATCWHSNWHAENGTPERSNPHWVKINRNSSTPFYGIAYLPRQQGPNTCCTSWAVYLLDKDPGDVTAASQAAIIAELGQPTYTGTWTGSTTLKTATFGGDARTEQYVLFVNLASYSSSSAACAEFNLLTAAGAKQYGNSGTGTGTGDGKEDPVTPAQTFNAVKITGVNGSTHRIAIDGTNLSFSMNGGAIRMGNSGITVEYSPAEVHHFSFENFEFPEATPHYTGTKADVNTARFDMAVDPANGAELPSITEITLSNPAGTLPTVNLNCALPITLSRNTSNSTTVKLEVTPARLAEMVKGDAYVITDVNETKLATYVLRVPADLFIDANGALSNEIVANWTVTEMSDGLIEKPAAADATITFSRRGDNLVIGALQRGSHVSLVNAAGVTVASATAGASGSVTIPVGSLANGVYLLTANATTLKIIL